MKTKKGPTQPRKSETVSKFVESHKVPATEKSTPRETQPRKADKVSSKSKQAPKGQQDEQLHSENFSRYGSDFTARNSVRKGL